MKSRIIIGLLVCITFTSFSQQDTYWKQVSVQSALKINKGNAFFTGFEPKAYLLFTLNESKIKSLLEQAIDHEKINLKNSTIILPVPMADGTMEYFRIIEYSVMPAALQKKYATIRSFKGQGLKNSSLILHFDFTPLGFHGMIIMSDGKSIQINPVNMSHSLYAVYLQAESVFRKNSFVCKTPVSSKGAGSLTNKTAPKGNADDNKLRTFKLALCTTGEWSRHFMDGSEMNTADSISKVMAAITTDLVRANALYEKDISLRMVFVDNEDTLIFLDPRTDPFKVTPPGENLNAACQQTCDSRIGNNNYDLGHVLAKGANNGNAGCIACVCKQGSKGSGQTTYSDPDLTNFLVIDYWAHELGHQFGANHTFTYEKENTPIQIEPGSGSTIMGYAGITGSTDIQQHTDDYFSCASIAQITSFIKSSTGGGKCAIVTNTGNNTPVVNAGADHSVPILTPLQLIGSGSDPDAGDSIIYAWEQIDAYEKGSNMFPRDTSTTGPLFRSRPYTSLPVRYLPELFTILNGKTANKWEVLPKVAREMNFRITAKDNNENGAANKSDDIIINVSAAAGPLK